MIQELKISNFLSFKEEVTFSFDASKDKKLEENQVIEVSPKVRLLRFAIIYGANASGKSNLLNAFEYLHDFWFDIKKNIAEKTGVIPFKFDKIYPDMPSVFSLKFYVKSSKYWYLLEVNENTVISEKLYYYSSVQPTLLFERVLQKNVSVVTFNQSAVKISSTAREEMNLKCLPNMSFFAARSQVNVALPLIDEACEWMKKGIMHVVSPKMNLFDYAEKKMQEDNQLKQHLLEFIQEADFNITGINTKVVNRDVPADFLDLILKSDSLPEDEKERLKIEKNLPQIKTDFEHTVINERGTEKYYLEDSLQSDGTSQITGLESIIYSALKEEALLVVDEIESSLHPELIIFVLKRFLEQNNNQSQLLITTHYDSLLSEVGDLFRKDSVWFTDKKSSGATELNSLSEIKGLNRITSMQKAYRLGKFGGIPKIQYNKLKT